MRTTMRVGILGLALAASAAAFGQVGTSAPLYDLKSEVALTGKVMSLKTIPDWMGNDGVNIALQPSDAAALAPHIDVATAEFLRTYDFPIAVGDDLTLTGCWSRSADGSRVFLVHELTKKRVKLMVRDLTGRPLW
jgi:hypothetical protein